MAKHDYFCPKCDGRVNNFNNWNPDGDPFVPLCPDCAIPLEINFGSILFSNPNDSSMYGKYVPALGRFIRSKGHKEEVLRELGLYEASDPVHGTAEPAYPEGYNGPGKPFTPPPAAPDPLAELTTWDLSEIPKIEKKVLDAVHSGNGAKYGIETVRPDQLTDEYTNRVLANVERGADDPEAA